MYQFTLVAIFWKRSGRDNLPVLKEERNNIGYK